MKRTRSNYRATFKAQVALAAASSRCLASTRFAGWRQLDVQGPSSGFGSRPGSVDTLVVHGHVSHALPVWRGGAGWRLTSRFRGLGPVAGNREFQNHGMMDHPIHGRRRGHTDP